LDTGIHTLDLLLWWLGQPDSFTYADDAMGGLEANAVITMRFGSTEGRIQLSRDWQTSQRYEFRFAHGQVGWTVNDANAVDLCLDGTPFVLQATLRDHHHALTRTNAQSFIAQLQHLAAAIHGQAPVLVDGHQGARALALIEACYAERTLLEQPWLTEPELKNAQRWASLP
jgi:predicted dehydrogenase